MEMFWGFGRDGVFKSETMEKFSDVRVTENSHLFFLIFFLHKTKLSVCIKMLSITHSNNSVS